MDLDSLSLDQLQALRQQKMAQLTGAINQNESAGAPDSATGIVNPASGARGNMQVMPKTAAGPGFGVKPSNGTPEDDARMGRDYYAAMQARYKDPTTAAIAYNMGPGKTDEWLKNGAKLDDLPLETLKYARSFAAQTNSLPASRAAQQPPQQPAGPPDLGPLDLGHGGFETDDAKRTALEQALNYQGPLDELTSGITHGVTNTLGGAAQKVAHGVGSALDYITGANQPNLTSLIAGQQPTLGTKIGNAGDTIARLAQAGTPTGVAGTVGQVLGGAALPLPATKSLLGTAGVAGALGAAQPVNNYQDPADFWKQTALQAGAGAGLGAAGHVVGAALGGLASPEARALAAQGATMTPGQAIGGAARSIEEKAKSIPGLGEAIGSAERANQTQFNKVLYQDALAPIGKTLPKDAEAGSAAIQKVHDLIGNEYDDMASKVMFRPQGIFRQQDLPAIRAELAQQAPGKLDQFNNIIANQIDNKMQSIAPGLAPTRLTGEQWNATRSYMTKLARESRMGNPDVDQLALSRALDDTVDAMNAQVARQAAPQFQSQLENANLAWAKYKRLEEAAGAKPAMTRGNVFTPAEYLSAVRTPSTKFQRATTTGLNTDLATQAQNILGNKFPNSGTIDRGLLAALMAGGPSLLFHNPLPMAAMGAGTSLYGTALGRALMQRAAMGVAPATGAMVRGASPLLGILGGSQ